MKKLTQKELIFEYFLKHKDKDIPHVEIVDWATHEWKVQTGTVFRDPDRAIRSLYQEGVLIKKRKGVYRYDSNYEFRRSQTHFTSNQREEIFERDEYKCVICGKGSKDGMELHADHIIPRDLGGESTISNGQTLCSEHNMLKKNLKQTETGKKMFIRLYELAQSQRNEKLCQFCKEVLEVYNNHGINSHIKWNDKS